MKVKYLFFVLFIVLLISGSCQNENNKYVKLNTSHLDYLYEEINVNDKEMAIIHIYSNYPSYKYIDDEDEGIACVDDAARAAIFYSEDFKINEAVESLSKNKKLLEFLIYLQAENGYFCNFIWSDYSINKDFKTSVAEPNWWSWRALWALSESYPYYKNTDKNFSDKIKISIEKLITAIKKDIPKEKNFETFSGLEIPSWLPYKFASDQAAVLILGLINYYNETNDEIILNYIKLLSDGILKMQINDETNPYNGAFLSWQNTWHAYGNTQAYALLKAYRIINDEEILKSALKELDNFYPKLHSINYISSFLASKENEKIIIVDDNKFSQIAYNFRPMIYSLLEAYEITKDKKYAILAGEIGKWFIGNNPKETNMYDQETGIIFDGIESAEKINMNSGAESTIEGLLSMLKISENEIAKETFNEK